MGNDITSLLKKFLIEGHFLFHEPINTGHINDTFKVITTKETYILQRINHHIFKNIPGLQDNIFRITNHIRSKLNAIGTKDIDRKVLTLILTVDGKTYYRDRSGNFWRVFLYIRGSRSVDQIDSPDLANCMGYEFGNFVAFFLDFPGPSLHDTIKNFHNIKWRLEELEAAIIHNRLDRLDRVKSEMYEIEVRSKEMLKMLNCDDTNTLPTRIVHRDTKINNILFDENDMPLCIIDLDTVMNGLITSDFGDAMRSGVNTSKEDEKDLDKISVDIGIFEGFTYGYMKAAAFFLVPNEINNLVNSVRLFTYMQAVRFLTDFINGDRYYKIDYPLHNYYRTRAQLKLLFAIEEHSNEMKLIVNKALHEFLK